jgi:hypothetical protein
VPVLTDARGKVIAGHGRVLAARLLGWSEVPTICLDHLSEVQARAFMIADNRLAENSTWDDRLLAEQLKGLSELELDFSLDVTGFEMGEIDLRIEGLVAEPEGDDPADALPEPQSGSPVSRPGDLWLLDRHRVYCASALEEVSYAALMQAEKAAMVFTDPPYNVPIERNVSGLGAIHHRDFAMASGEMDEAQYTAFLTQACALLAHHSVDGALHFIFTDWRHIGELLAAGRRAYAELKNVCVWVKITRAWEPSIAADTSSSSCSSTAARRIATTSCSVNTAVIALTCGSIRVLARPARRATCSLCTPRLSR